MKKPDYKTPLTKLDLEERFTKFHIAFSTEMDHKFQVLEEKGGVRFNTFTDKILTAIDPLIQELETRQQDREIGTAQIEEIKAHVDNHEKRITKLEHS